MNKEHTYFCKLHKSKWPKFRLMRRCFRCKHIENLSPVNFAELKK